MSERTPPGFDQGIADYYERFPEENVRRALNRVRKTIRKAAPDAQETISYRIPAFTLEGHLVYFAHGSITSASIPRRRGSRNSRRSCRSISWRRVRCGLTEPPHESMTGGSWGSCGFGSRCPSTASTEGIPQEH